MGELTKYMPNIEQIFNTPIRRRTALVAGATGVASVLTALGIRIAKAQEAVAGISTASPEALAAKFTEDVDIYKLKIAQALNSPAPEQYSTIFPDQNNNGDSLMAFDVIIFKQDPAGNVTVADALTRLDTIRPLKGISDQDLIEGKLGGQIIPPLTKDILPVPQSVIDTVVRLGEAIDLPLLKVTGAIPGGTYRIGDNLGDYFTLANNPDTNQFRLGNIAIPLTNAGLIPEGYRLLKPETATGGGNTEIQPGLVFETLQSGKGKQTEWVLQKSPDSPITAVVQRPDALAHVADTYLPKGGLKKVKIIFLPAFEGFGMYNGLDFSSNGTSILLTDSIYGPAARFKAATTQHDDTLEIYFSPNQEKGYETLPLMQQDQGVLDKVNNGISSYIGTLIAEAGGYPRIGAGRVAPEAAALKSNSNGQLSTIVLALT